MRKRSKYKPRTVIQDPLNYVLNGFRPLAHSGDTLLTLRTRNHSALAALVQGNAIIADIDELIAAYNITAVLCWKNLGEEYIPEVKAALDAIEAIAERQRKLGRFTCTGLEIQALNLGMEVHDAQLDIVTINDVAGAIQTVQTVYRKGAARRLDMTV